MCQRLCQNLLIYIIKLNVHNTHIYRLGNRSSVRLNKLPMRYYRAGFESRPSRPRIELLAILLSHANWQFHAGCALVLFWFCCMNTLWVLRDLDWKGILNFIYFSSLPTFYYLLQCSHKMVISLTYFNRITGNLFLSKAVCLIFTLLWLHENSLLSVLAKLSL